MKKNLIICGIIACAVCCQPAYAVLNDFQGFETDTGDWSFSNSDTAIVPSGGGTLGVSSASGNQHLELHNLPGGYDPYGYGDGGYSYFGGKNTTYPGPFYQAVDVYIDTNWAQPTTNLSQAAFWIDMAPASTSGSSFFAAEHNFRFYVDGSGTIDVQVDNNGSLGQINQSGWYTFEMVYYKGASESDLIKTDLNVYTQGGSLVGTMTDVADSPGDPGVSSLLGGNSYIWISVWQDGFADDVIAIDNVQTGMVPEPATLALLGLGGLLLRKRQ